MQVLIISPTVRSAASSTRARYRTHAPWQMSKINTPPVGFLIAAEVARSFVRPVSHKDRSTVSKFNALHTSRILPVCISFKLSTVEEGLGCRDAPPGDSAASWRPRGDIGC